MNSAFGVDHGYVSKRELTAKEKKNHRLMPVVTGISTGTGALPLASKSMRSNSAHPGYSGKYEGFGHKLYRKVNEKKASTGVQESERARRVRALAERGVGGEKTNAKAAYEKMMAGSKAKKTHGAWKAAAKVVSTPKRGANVVAAAGIGTAAGFGAAYGGAVAHESKRQILAKKPRKPRQPVTKSDNSKAAGSSVAGATAGQVAYQAAGYGSKKVIRRGYGHNTPAGKINNPKVKARKKTWEQAKKTQRKKGFLPVDAETKAQFWRTLPKDVHGARVLRTAGWTHAGKTGMATGAASTAAGGVAGYLAMKKEKK